MNYSDYILPIERDIHFIGIGGIGMSALAQILLETGYRVSGSDLKATNITGKMVSMGAKISFGHKALNLPKDAGLVIYSSSIKSDNPEFQESKKRDLPVMHRGELLANIFNSKKGIAVTGAHGKTTTTTLISLVFKNAGLDPTIMIGGETENLKGNAACGKGEYMVAEADESDGSFMKLNPLYEVITNIDLEHVDYYKNIDAIKKANEVFVNNIKEGGCFFYCGDDEKLRKIAEKCGKKSKSYGFSEDSDCSPRNIKTEGRRLAFDCFCDKSFLFSVSLHAPGAHNALNASAAVLVGLQAGIKPECIKGALESYRGIKRRFEIKGVVDGVTVVEDYAHHPTEIEAVLKAARAVWKKNRIISIFQPHRFTRTMYLCDEFAKSLSISDMVILTDIYSAFEKPIQGVSIKTIYDKVTKDNIDKVNIIPKKDITRTISGQLRPDDVVLVLGAGDIGEISGELLEVLKKRA